ncbi:hypothetical protein J41TS4_25490 [Paenibacillus apis]|uniref:Uncharacterized protein n=1 Tax=Paenibacillus apis TaxID=1792174 RepID=A0A920CJI1_9BACL|nr:hypothetical protein J41TS4_25490 [Paenibacillus apis]
MYLSFPNHWRRGKANHYDGDGSREILQSIFGTASHGDVVPFPNAKQRVVFR